MSTFVFPLLGVPLSAQRWCGCRRLPGYGACPLMRGSSSAPSRREFINGLSCCGQDSGADISVAASLALTFLALGLGLRHPESRCLTIGHTGFALSHPAGQNVPLPTSSGRLLQGWSSVVPKPSLLRPTRDLSAHRLLFYWWLL